MKKKLSEPEPPPPSPSSQPPQMDSGETPSSRNTKIRRVKKYLHILPPEVVEEILARLPVKSVLRFRCVSKSWRSSIESRFFVNKRLRSSAELKVISNDTADDPNKHLMKDSTVVGSCNGLLCILKDKCFFLWNPTTRISIELPKLDFQSPITKYGFGWDEGSDAYKVFVILSEEGQKIGKVYSSSTNSWKTVEHGSLCMRYRYRGFFSCGNIHWLTESGDRIESFDLKSEVFGTVELPFELQGYIRLMQKDGCIAVSDNNKTRIDLWVMKKYWVKESWVKQITAPIPLEYRHDYFCKYSIQDDGEVKFFRCKSNFYNAVKQYHYVESLVSPVFTLRQEQVPTIPIVDDQLKHQIKISKESEEIVAASVEVNKEVAPKRQSKRRAAGVEVIKEVVEVSKEAVPNRQSKRIAALVEVSYKEVVHGRQSKRIAASADENKEVVPRHQSKRIAARVQEIVQDKVQKSIGESPPKRQNKRKEMVKEQAHPSVVEGRPKRQNR